MRPAARSKLHQNLNTLRRDSPNSDEALSLLSISQPPTKGTIEQACSRFLEIGVGRNGNGHVVIRSGALGAYVASRQQQGRWVGAFWSEEASDKVIDVTGKSLAYLTEKKPLYLC